MGEIIARPSPPVPLAFTGERLTSSYGGQTQIEHLHRYLLAREWCRGRDVLDVASGEGYGTCLLAQVARTAVGIDIAQDAVTHATASYRADNLRYATGDARAIPVADASVDIVVSFETIEHFTDQPKFIAEIRRVLRQDGLFIVSTPDLDNYAPAGSGANPFHVKELTGEEFSALLHARFAEVAVVLQRPIFGSVITSPDASTAAPLCFERRGDQHFERSAGLARPQYRLAFASAVPIPAVPPSVYIDTGRLGMLSPTEAQAQLQSSAETLQAQARGAATSSAALQSAQRELAEKTASFDDAQAQLADRMHALSHAEAAAEQSNRDLQLLQAGQTADRETIRTLESDLAASRAEIVAARGEATGLLAATEMTERACAVLRQELVNATRAATAAEAALQCLRDAPPPTSVAMPIQDTAAAERRIADLQQELHAAQNLAASAQARIHAIGRSTSWRLTAPLRRLVRLLRGQS